MNPINRRHFSLSLLGASLTSACSLAPQTRPVAAGLTSAKPSPYPAPAPDPDPANTLRPDLSRYRALTLQVNGQAIPVRAFEGLPTATLPLEPDYQQLNLYVPDAYFRGGSVGRYDARNAPIFLPNQVGGYMPAKPGTPEGGMGPPPAPGTTAPPSAIAVALARGYVVAAPGARGRTLRAADGRWTGKAPAAIVDLKAAVRWLRHNAGRFPGNAERILSNGTSAGGALSALLGASGNHPGYAAELQAIGAAPQRDDIHAVSAYCPITNLDHADAAYEWQFRGVHDYRRIEMSMLDFHVTRREVAGTLTPAQIALSQALAASFPDYVNALGLRDAAGHPLRLDDEGRGSLRDHLASLLLQSAQRALDAGQDLRDRTWLRLQAGRAQAVDFEACVRAMGRMKVTPAFDDLALNSGENSLFGNASTDARHFTAWAAAHGSVAGASQAEPATVRLMNAMDLVRDAAATAAPAWRIRHGTMDRDTSLAIPALLAAAARSRGLDVDLALPWDRPHSGDYDLDELFDWFEHRI